MSNSILFFGTVYYKYSSLEDLVPREAVSFREAFRFPCLEEIMTFTKSVIKLQNLLFPLLLSTVLFFLVVFLPSTKIFAYELKDPNLWIQVDGIFDITEDIMTLKGELGCAVYQEEVNNHECVKFNAKFLFSDPKDSWVAFKFRSNNPFQHIWNNENTYFFIVKANEIIGGRVTEGGAPEYLIRKNHSLDLNENAYDLEVGVINECGQDIPKLVFVADGETIIDYCDFTATKEQQHMASFFSVNVFRGGMVEIISYPETKPVTVFDPEKQPPPSDFTGLDSYNEKWSILQHVGMGKHQYYKTHFQRNDKALVLHGIGSLVYKDAVDISAIRFNLQFDRQQNIMDSVNILLGKAVRDSYFGHYSYGLYFYPDGRIGPVTYNEDKERKYSSIKTGLDFCQSITLTVQILENPDKIKILVFADQNGYIFEFDNVLPPDNEDRFFGVINNDTGQSITLKDIEYKGNIIPYHNSEPIKPVYLQDYFVEGEGKSVRWKYRADEPSYFKAVITDNNGEVVGEVLYPENSFFLPDFHIFKELYITVETIDGVRSEKVLVHLDEPEILSGKNSERINIRYNKSGADFYLSQSGRRILLTGVNYVELRFGCHSTFEPPGEFIQAQYDPYAVESMFRLLKRSGFNTVRIFVSSGRSEGNTGTGGPYDSTSKISEAYMDNVVDFLQKAQKHGIYVIATFANNELPNNQYFDQYGVPATEQEVFFNEKFLKAKLDYVNLFLNYIKSKDSSLLKVLLAIQAQNEFTFNAYQEPFLQTLGHYYFFGNGTSYDMSNANERRSLAKAALKNYYRALRNEINRIDPELLLAEGTATILSYGVEYHKNPGIFPRGPNYITMTAAEFLETDIDFLDIHIYATSTTESGNDIVKAGMDSMLLNTPESLELMKRKPVIMGEYGSSKAIKSSFDSAKHLLLAQRDVALSSGLKGVLFWTFDSFHQNDFYTAMEDHGKFLFQLGNLAVEESGASDLLFRTAAPYLSAIILVLFIAISGIFTLRKKPLSPTTVPEHEALKNTEKQVVPAISGRTASSQPIPPGDVTPGHKSLNQLKEKLERIKQYPFTCNLFGEFQLYQKGSLVEGNVFSSLKTKELLAYMLNEGRDLSKDEIITSLWQDSSKGLNALFHSTLYKLRNDLKKLNPDYKYILYSNGLYSVQKGVFFCTHHLYGNEFEKLTNTPGSSPEEIRVIQTIVSYYNNDYLYSYDYEWSNANREYYHALYAKALIHISRHHLDHSSPLDAVKHLNTLIRYNPYLEEAYYLLIKAYSELNNIMLSKKTYRTYCTVLKKEMGLEPSEEIVLLYQTILARHSK